MTNKIKTRIKIQVLTLLSLMFSASPAFSIEISKHISTIIDPVPIKRIEPKYPIDAARDGKSGWAKLSFVINEEGRVKDVVINEVVGHRGFGKAAKKALRKWQYSPAMEDGKPIQQCVNTMQMSFQISRGGVSKKFRAEYGEALAAIDDKNYDLLKKKLEEMSKYAHGMSDEINHYHTLSAHYAEHIKNESLELYHLNRISLLDGSADSKRKLSILNKRFYLSVNLNKFQEAFKIYDQLQKLDAAKPHMAAYNKMIEEVDAFISSENNIIIPADIEDKDFWFYSLVRNEFSLVDINGSLNKLDVRCANKRHVYTVEENNTWSIPKSWKNCSVLIYGDDNTRFKLVEHPLKS